MIKRSLVILLCGGLLLSCSPPLSPDRPASASQDTGENTEEFLGQVLPIEAQALLGGEVIALEVARTPAQQALGLMYRTQLPDSRGMLFPLAEPRVPRFWMKNVKIPLDMIFLRDGEIRAIAANVPPCTSNPCPTYGPDEVIDQVIELAGGRAAQLGLEVGDRVEIEFFPPR